MSILNGPMNVATYQKKENEISGKRELGEEEKNNQLILERVRAALLWSFRGQHSKKNGWYEGSAWDSWNPDIDMEVGTTP